MNLIHSNILSKMTMTDIQKIQAITKDILEGYYGTVQRCGTETQK